MVAGNGVNATFAFSSSYLGGKTASPTGTANYFQQLSFHASNSNSVYTDSGKVYPLSLALNFIIKA